MADGTNGGTNDGADDDDDEFDEDVDWNEVAKMADDKDTAPSFYLEWKEADAYDCATEAPAHHLLGRLYQPHGDRPALADRIRRTLLSRDGNTTAAARTAQTLPPKSMHTSWPATWTQ
jgi:hypothetical protein